MGTLYMQRYCVCLCFASHWCLSRIWTYSSFRSYSPGSTQSTPWWRDSVARPSPPPAPARPSSSGHFSPPPAPGCRCTSSWPRTASSLISCAVSWATLRLISRGNAPPLKRSKITRNWSFCGAKRTGSGSMSAVWRHSWQKMRHSCWPAHLSFWPRKSQA